MMAALVVLALAASGPQDRPEALLQDKATIALECPGTGRDSDAPSCHPVRVQGTESEASPPLYCQGFSASDCAEIQRTVNAPTEPAYCAPGFGLPERGLNPVQLRACYVIASRP